MPAGHAARFAELPPAVADPVATTDHERLMTRVSSSAVLLLLGLALAGTACRQDADEKQEVRWLPVERAPVAPVPTADAAPVRPAGVEPEQVEAAEAVRAWFKTLAAAARG